MTLTGIGAQLHWKMSITHHNKNTTLLRCVRLRMRRLHIGNRRILRVAFGKMRSECGFRLITPTTKKMWKVKVILEFGERTVGRAVIPCLMVATRSGTSDDHPHIVGGLRSPIIRSSGHKKASNATVVCFAEGDDPGTLPVEQKILAQLELRRNAMSSERRE